MPGTTEKPPNGEKSDDTVSRPPRRKNGSAGSRWTISIVLAIGVHAAAVLILRTPAIEVGTKESRATTIAWLGPQAATTETLIGEQLALFDNAPLFLPTEWNYAVVQGSARYSDASAGFFPDFGNKFVFETDGSPTAAIKMPATYSTSLEAVREFQWPYLSAFGRVDRSPIDLSPRVAWIQVRAIGTGEVVFSAPVSVESAPAAGGWPDWRPFSLLFEINELGTVGEPLVAPPGSQAEDVDAFFRRFVKMGLQLGLLLAPGYYQATVGP